MLLMNNLKKFKVLIYGHGRRYDEIAPVLRAYNGVEMDIEGIITTDSPKYKMLDGIPCFKAEEVLGGCSII